MMKSIGTVIGISALLAILSACSPEVGSDEWCKDMKAKDKTDITAQQAADYAKHCVF